MENTFLSFYEEKHKDGLLTFYLPENQEKFTQLPSQALELCKQDEERYPIVIKADGKTVGFFVLHKGENIRDFTANTNAMVIRALSINHTEQGKGYAKAAMMQVSSFVSKHFPEINELVLAVNFKNEPAKQLYEKAGFQDRGQIKHGPVGPQYVLHLDI